MRGFATVIGGILLSATAACHALTSDGALPAGTPDPAFYNTVNGARGLRNASVLSFEVAFRQYILDSGLLTDELADSRTGITTIVTDVPDPLDERILPEGMPSGEAASSYPLLQNTRGNASLAENALATYDTAASDHEIQQSLRGELYALTGATEIFLADLYCSGVPLSTLDFQKDYTYASPSTTNGVYRAALANLTTATGLLSSSDSSRVLAQVLQGRAYLALGLYDSAAAAVATVPTTFHYSVVVQWGINRFSDPNLPLAGFLSTPANAVVGTVADQEGTNGLPYISSGDPRTAVQISCVPDPNNRDNGCPIDTLRIPIKYAAEVSGTGYLPIPLASGIEARLIQAEAALHGVATGTGSWLDQLNALRGPTLPALNDPGTPQGRVALLFQERAYWLFLTGHRQGDLRRLLRQYAQYPAFISQDRVYPTGTYVAIGAGRYGTDVTVPVPGEERTNPYFHGCLTRNP